MGRRKLKAIEMQQETYLDDGIEEVFDPVYELDEDESEEPKKDKRLSESDAKKATKAIDEVSSERGENPEKNKKKVQLNGGGSESKI